MAIDKETVRAEYIALIGYDPFEDDPSMTVDEVREIIADYKHNVALYGGDVTDGGFGPYVPDPVQTRSDVDCEPDAYPGWHSMQSAARDAW